MELRTLLIVGLTFSLGSLIAPSPAFAAPSSTPIIKVKKAKGKQAVIESNFNLEEGKSYIIGEESMTITPDFSQKFQSRNNSFSLGFNLTFLEGDRVKENNISGEARYGWNLQNFEFGPTGEFASVDSGAGADNTFAVGGYLDYNLKRNKHPEYFLFGPTATASFGSTQFAGGGSANLLGATVGGFLTLYLAGTTTAMKVEAGYQRKQVSATVGQTNMNGFYTKAFLLFYF